LQNSKHDNLNSQKVGEFCQGGDYGKRIGYLAGEDEETITDLVDELLDF
jgi:hypothetical protein